MRATTAYVALAVLLWPLLALSEVGTLAQFRNIADARGDLDDRAFAQKVDRAYRALKAAGADGVGTEPGPSFEAAYLALFYSPNEGHLEDLRRAFEAIASQRAPTSDEVADLHKALLKMREFDQADALAKRFPGLGIEILPPRSAMPALKSGERLVWNVRKGAGGAGLIASGLAPPADGILVSTHPRCGFSRRAAADIAADPALAELFARHAVLLGYQAGWIDQEGGASWDLGESSLTHRWVHRQADWPEITEWATPVFYFIRDGSVVAEVTGWPKEGRRQALLEAAAAAGLSFE